MAFTQIVSKFCVATCFLDQFAHANSVLVYYGYLLKNALESTAGGSASKGCDFRYRVSFERTVSFKFTQVKVSRESLNRDLHLSLIHFISRIIFAIN